MNKVIIAIFLCMALLFCGCSRDNTNTEVNDATEVTLSPNQLKLAELKEQFPGPAIPKTNVYVNEKCGYSFKFPEDYTGWYFVNDENPDIAIVRFYGKSVRGTLMEKAILSTDYEYGLTMFFILSEEEANTGFYDSVTKIGTAKGINYYFATTTDVSLAPIIGEGDFWFDEIEEEQQLVKADWEKAKTMMSFYKDGSSLINAFSEI